MFIIPLYHIKVPNYRSLFLNVSVRGYFKAGLYWKTGRRYYCINGHLYCIAFLSVCHHYDLLYTTLAISNHQDFIVLSWVQKLQITSKLAIWKESVNLVRTSLHITMVMLFCYRLSYYLWSCQQTMWRVWSSLLRRRLLYSWSTITASPKTTQSK